MKYYIIVGEASGDMHAANLMKSLIKHDHLAQFRFCGGEKMQSVGGTLYNHYKENNFMGFLEVAKNLRKIMKYMKRVKMDVVKFQPDALILVDYPGFNLRMAAFAKSKKIPVHYYIAPQVWAWKASRIKKIKAFVDYLYCILPFEKAYFAKQGFESDYLGNPLLDEIQNYQPKSIHDISDELPIIAMLPGSRMMELKEILPVMVKAAKELKGFQCVIAAAPSIEKSFFDQYTKGEIPVVYHKTYDLLSKAHLAMVTSGTATLETGLFKVPQVVCYKTSNTTYLIAKNLVKIKYISLVNLVLDKLAVPELIQKELTVLRLKTQLLELNKGDKRNQMLADYEHLSKIMGDGGASDSIAQKIFNRTIK